MLDFTIYAADCVGNSGNGLNRDASFVIRSVPIKK